MFRCGLFRLNAKSRGCSDDFGSVKGGLCKVLNIIRRPQEFICRQVCHQGTFAADSVYRSNLQLVATSQIEIVNRNELELHFASVLFEKVGRQSPFAIYYLRQEIF